MRQIQRRAPAAGDVVYFPPSGPRAAVGGSVRTAIYELKGGNKVADLIQMAGGLSRSPTSSALPWSAFTKTTPVVLEFKLDAQGVATGIGDGDLLYVSTIDPRFANAVTLRGNVANPGRFPGTPACASATSSRIRKPSSLATTGRNTTCWDMCRPTKECGRTRIETRRTPAGTISPQHTHADRVRNPHADRDRYRRLRPRINWTYAVIERQNARDLKTELVALQSGKLVLDGDETQNLELRPGTW